MPTYNDTRVKIPEHCIKLNKNGNTYIYRIVRAYRKNGKPTNDRKLIGKLDPNTNELIPNESYYEFYPDEKPVTMPDFIRKCGSYAVIKQIVKEIGLDTEIRRAFPDLADDILTAAHYMSVHDSVMYYLNDWLDESLSFSADAVTDVSVSRMFSKIDAKSRAAFFREWIKKRANKEFLAYDVTSFSTLSRGIEDREYGYNRDKEKLPQINFGMYYGKESQLPLYYRTYPGSITDKTHLRYMTDDLVGMDAKKMYLLMDRGFFTEENLKYLVEQGIRFLIAMPTCNLFRKLIDENKDKIVDRLGAKMPDQLLYVQKVESNAYGFRMNAHIFYDPEKSVVEKENFFAAIERMEREIPRMSKMPARNSNYCKFFNISFTDSIVHFERNIDAIEAELGRCGFFIIVETAFNLTSSEVLNLYRKRDVIEKSFDDLKNEIDLKRLRCHRSETADGKMFIAFLSLVIRSQVHMKLQEFLKKNNATLRKVFLELDKIKVTQVPSIPGKLRLINPLTKYQRTILETLGMDESVFLDLI